MYAGARRGAVAHVKMPQCRKFRSTPETSPETPFHACTDTGLPPGVPLMLLNQVASVAQMPEHVRLADGPRRRCDSHLQVSGGFGLA
jgi:hypothetical protein